MKINILQKGGNKNHELLERAIKFYGSQLMSTRMLNTLSLRVEIRATKLEKKTMGTCSTKAQGSISNKDFKIMLQRDMSLKDQLETIAHEMVHVWQKATNKLQFRVWKSDGQMHTRWNGNDAGVSGEIPYLDRPWEKEAFFLEKPLFKLFRAHEKGLTDDIPDLESDLKNSVKRVIRKREDSLESSINY